MGKSARDAKVHLNAFDLSGYFRGLDISDDMGLEDSTTWGANVVAKSATNTIDESTVSLKGFWDPTLVTGVNVVIRAALRAATKTILSLWPTGDAVGEAGMGFQADVSSRKVTGEVDGLVMLEVELKSSVGDEDIISLHALAAETIDGSGTIVDNGASSANGGSAYLHVPDIATSIVVTIRHSTDNFGASDVLLGTFATVSVDRGEERITFTGTVNRYVRVVWDLTGTATFGCGIHRN